eukprot:3818951-Pyramimonas_sp.AAC.1
MQRLFQAIADRKYCAPGSWKRFLVTFIPKNSQTKNLADTGKICLIPLMSKWYSLCLTILAEQQLSTLDTSVGIYGFAEGRRSHEITAAIKRIAQHASLREKVTPCTWHLAASKARGAKTPSGTGNLVASNWAPA